MAIALDDLSFAAALEQNPIETAPLCEAMGEMFADGKTKPVDSWMDKLLAKLAERQQHVEAITVLKHAAGWKGQSSAFKSFCKERLDRLFREDEDNLKLVANAGFDNVRLRAQECLRRLETLFGFEPDVMCCDRTWGFGIVKVVMMDDNKVMINFTEKPDHRMALSYAAESVRIVDEHHLLAMKHLKPDELTGMVKSDPAEIVRMAIRSFGAKPAPILQEILVPAVVPETRWKRFWEVARKELKVDPLVVMPAKRSEAIQLLVAAKSFDEGWFAELAAERDMNKILVSAGEYIEQDDEPDLAEEQQEILNERLGFVVKGAQTRFPDLTVQAILMGRTLGIELPDIQADGFVEKAYEYKEFIKVNDRLHAKERKVFLRFLVDHNPDEAMNLYLSVLGEVEYNTLNEIIGLLMDNGREDDATEVLRRGWNTWSSNVFQLHWFDKHLERVEETWEFGNRYDLVMRMLADIENEYHGDENRVQNQLRERFRNDKWLAKMFETFDERQRRTVTSGVRNSTGWEKLEKNSVLGQIVKIDPTMQQIVSGKASDESGVLRRGPVISWRMYKTKLARLRHIESHEIPENSKEIATAREYGDLRENFEYHAAKDKQRLLLQEKEELDKELSSATPTDFSTFSTEVSGVGTGVTIQYDGGKRKTFFILGVADSEEDLGIISTHSPMAKSLTGMVPEDSVMVPSTEGEVSATIKEVTGLSPAVREWVGDAPDSGPVEVESLPIEES